MAGLLEDEGEGEQRLDIAAGPHREDDHAHPDSQGAARPEPRRQGQGRCGSAAGIAALRVLLEPGSVARAAQPVAEAHANGQAAALAAAAADGGRLGRLWQLVCFELGRR